MKSKRTTYAESWNAGFNRAGLKRLPTPEIVDELQTLVKTRDKQIFQAMCAFNKDMKLKDCSLLRSTIRIFMVN